MSYPVTRWGGRLWGRAGARGRDEAGGWRWRRGRAAWRRCVVRGGGADGSVARFGREEAGPGRGRTGGAGSRRDGTRGERGRTRGRGRREGAGLPGGEEAVEDGEDADELGEEEGDEGIPRQVDGRAWTNVRRWGERRAQRGEG